MTLGELLERISNFKIKIMRKDGDGQHTLIYRGESRFFRPTDKEYNLWVHHIATDKHNSKGIFVLCED